MKVAKIYSVESMRVGLRGNSTPIIHTGTIPELIECFSYTLECGASWSGEKGNKKINRNPKNIKTLITNLNNAAENTNGALRSYYRLIEE